MARINITLPDGLLAEIDEAAAAAGKTRSGFIQEAGARYAAEVRAGRARDERQERILAAQRTAAEIGSRLPPGPDGLTILRELRYSYPDWAPKVDEEDERA
ncbi:MAG: ribbon-helix-helix protein, CopG family [Actinobacteria bacterium]|nr:MAG: ribbon-helix-helix protein, CopG family [Actinomycetota bacterium]